MSSADVLAIFGGALTTLLLSAAGIAAGLPIGLGMALVRWGRVPVAARGVAIYVSLLRATPLVTLVLLLFFALPNAGIPVGPISAGVLALTLNTAAFNCEIWRAGLMNFPAEQLEAARAFGMMPLLRLRRIIFPQLWRASLPGLVNEATLLIKASPAIAVVGVAEITRAATRIGAQTYEPLPPMLAATAIYVAIILVLVGLQRLTERRYGRTGASA